ncbi:MAG: hypothetical protein LCH63_20225 [Candidatus Melainabacteria bacterium]|uniref:Uncharacterized protein n=1 Tax=Candidatus Obscuribacter phosphatis TaxID=1906157 RepID=A0A8J7PIN6_9BACT|nr:hypothetical protein [Candidatus Obscuribacter phosphatis]MCA0316158.1 hypothetical protein [Candidatus Melainabacteria bacterium]
MFDNGDSRNLAGQSEAKAPETNRLQLEVNEEQRFERGLGNNTATSLRDGLVQTIKGLLENEEPVSPGKFNVIKGAIALGFSPQGGFGEADRNPVADRLERMAQAQSDPKAREGFVRMAELIRPKSA